MVVEADLLPKIKELIKKLDVPKKMVQIEVLAVEKELVATKIILGSTSFTFGDSARNIELWRDVFNRHVPTKNTAQSDHRAHSWAFLNIS